ALGEIKRLNDGPVQVYVYDNNVAFVQAAVSLVVRLIDGEFPAYNKVIPTDNPGSIGFAGRDLLDSVDRVRQVAASKSAGIKLEASGNEITLVAESKTGSARDIVVAEINGEALQIAVSAAFLSDAISSLGDDVCAKYKTDREPLILFPLDYGRFSERLEVVMPMRL
ncbi:MAG: hypothetical protein L3J63_06880, partial [Geopsychrobacter sp.]|nr:hypothetical protein [Geopsychrobacter sp.]